MIVRTLWGAALSRSSLLLAVVLRGLPFGPNAGTLPISCPWRAPLWCCGRSPL